MSRIVALVWAAAGVFIGYMGLKMALGPKADASGWVMSTAFLLVAGFCGWSAWKDWRTTEASRTRPPPQPARADRQTMTGASATPSVKPVTLETQMAGLASAGLSLAPGRTVEELLNSFSREEYEADPYVLLLVMYGSEVEAEPWGRAFSERVWNFDMECLSEAGDYASAFAQMVRITGQPELVSELSDDFSPEADTVRIRYAISGRARTLNAVVDNDWADPEVVMAFARDIENTIGDGRRYWAADNGQASVLIFLSDADAAAISTLRPGVLETYLRG